MIGYIDIISERFIRNDKKSICKKGKSCGDICIPKTSACSGNTEIDKKTINQFADDIVSGNQLAKGKKSQAIQYNREALESKSQQDLDRINKKYSHLFDKRTDSMVSYIDHSGYAVNLDSLNLDADCESCDSGDCNCADCKKKKKKSLTKITSDSVGLIARAISQTFDAPVDAILSLDLPNGRIDANVFSDNKLYRVREDSDNYLLCEYLPGKATELNQYAKGVLDYHGVRSDNSNTFLYASGYFRSDAPLKCAPGNTPCGKKCLPKGQQCRNKMGASAQNNLREGVKGLQNKAQGAMTGAKKTYEGTVNNIKKGGVQGYASGLARRGGKLALGAAVGTAALAAARKGSEIINSEEGREAIDKGKRSADVKVKTAMYNAGAGVDRGIREAKQNLSNAARHVKKKMGVKESTKANPDNKAKK